MTERVALRNQLSALMKESDPQLSDVAFNELALRIFGFQFEDNTPYRKYCERRGVVPDAIDHWLQVPAVPTAAFKEAALVSGNAANAEAIFRTSGTTQGKEKRGVHYVLDLDLYERSLLPAFQKFVLAGESRVPMVSLVPAWQSGGESSLSYMISTVLRELGSTESRVAVGSDGIDYASLHDWIASQDNPVCVLGTSLAFVHWFDHLMATNGRFNLPAGSCIMDTGGFKGSTRAVTSEELRAQYEVLLGVDSRSVVNEYGMTEMLSQFYDAHRLHVPQMRVKRGPAWVRSAIVDAETLEPLTSGETGLLKHFDLANLFSVSAIQTEDIAVSRGDGFELLGRAAGAAARGCSIAMDMFLSSTHT
jgi:hypothetical protein